METKNSWLVRYDLNQSKTIPERPTQYSSLCKRILLLTVSNAALRSRRTRTERLFKSVFVLSLVYHFNQYSLCAMLGSQTRLKRLEDVVVFDKSMFFIKNNFF